MSDSGETDTKRAVVTVKHVAERVGVSLMTVSRVLNQPEKVKPETAERVRKAIRELNYRPNPVAQSLAGRRSLLIGLLYNNPSANYLAELMLGAMAACRERGHHLLVEDYIAGRAWDDAEAIAEAIRGSGVQGLIVCPPVGERPEAGKMIEAAGLPFVRIAPGEETTDAPYVMIDDHEAARGMTEHLIALGHERIGFIEGPPDQVSSARRRRGFEAAMAAAGLPHGPDLRATGDYTYRSGMEAALELLAPETRPTAIFASNDDMAAGAIAAALQRGLTIPDDLSIAGFDDVSLASSIWPPLTTVRQPIREMAAEAVRLLEAAARDGRSVDPVILPTTVIARESVQGR
ncbi:LacI family DNA-binding transcriptional regulator [Parvularcula lutaonensis]|uniref:LacI family DNA-binding transcriptional regulator n=2 Tax=Parvularcula lutaonensis TaxID=491923 RepID=A0ABV7MAN2_9PROT|nr:LacI family transcriptional regulator [Parvularcula lutaonensis]